MKIKVINPNTTASITEKISASAWSAASPGTEILAVNPADGPASIEGYYDEAMCLYGLMTEIIRGEESEGCDGYVIACFGDPGLLAAREISCGPVIGIAEAAIHMASFIATGFSVVTTLTRTRPMTEDLLLSYGMAHRCRSVRATDLEVLELEQPESEAYLRIEKECRAALRDDGVGAIVLGCAGMADLASNLTKDLGIPVIDGVAAAVRITEALVGLGLHTSKIGDLAFPLSKNYEGTMTHMAPGFPSQNQRCG